MLARNIGILCRRSSSVDVSKRSPALSTMIAFVLVIASSTSISAPPPANAFNSSEVVQLDLEEDSSCLFVKSTKIPSSGYENALNRMTTIKLELAQSTLGISDVVVHN